MKKKRFYLNVNSCVRYDKRGVTHPESVAIPLEELATAFFCLPGNYFSWEPLYGWGDEVLCFTTTDWTAKLFGTVCNAFFPGFLVVERAW